MLWLEWLCKGILTILFLCSATFLVMYCVDKPKQIGMIVFLSLMTAMSIILIIVFVVVLQNAPQVVGEVICL
jgi:hypothetical protein